MRRTASLLLIATLAPILAACSRGSDQGVSSARLGPDEKVARAVLATLAADGKPVCVERQTFGSPLSIYRIARQGRLEDAYALEWYPAKPFRPPVMPTLQELRADAAAGRDADMPEPEARTDAFPAPLQAALDQAAMALAPPEVPTRRVSITRDWAPKGVVPRWWPANRHDGCTAQYVLSGVKMTPKVAFAAVRVDHWATLYALVPHGDDWRPIAQWGSWLY